MGYTLLVMVAIAASAGASAYAGEAFAHGLGSDVAPPLDLDGRNVTVSTAFNPLLLDIESLEDATMTVRFFDVDSDDAFGKVTYRIEIWQRGELLAREHFYDDSDTLNVDIKPKPGCTESKLWRCTTYGGERHPIAGAFYTFGATNPSITGPVLTSGGLYNIKVDVVGAESARTLVADELSYDTFLSVADTQPFTIRTAHAEEVPVTVKTYYDHVTNFEYSTSDDSVSFEMPFDWDPEYVELVPIVHEELQFPKTFSPYDTDQFIGYINGVEVEKRVIVFDPYTYEDRNVVHFIIGTDEMQRIGSLMARDGDGWPTSMEFKLVPTASVQTNAVDAYLVDSDDRQTRTGSTVSLSWPATFGAGDDIPFEFTFFDEAGQLLRDARYGYVLFNDETGELVADALNARTRDPGLTAIEGIDTQVIGIPSDEAYRIDVLLYGQGQAGVNYDDSYAGIGSLLVEVPPAGTAAPPRADDIIIPGWVKATAGAWSGDLIGDAEFANALAYLVSEGIIVVPAVDGDPEAAPDAAIPSWIKDVAAKWSEGVLTDRDFANGLGYLIAQGIVSAEPLVRPGEA